MDDLPGFSFNGNAILGFLDKVLFPDVEVVVICLVVTLSFFCSDFGINLLYCNLQILDF